MRVVVLALTLALVAGQSHHLTHVFEAHKTYVYQYETTLMGGMQEEKLAKSGLNFSSKVLISAESGNIYLLKLEEPEIFELNGVLSKDPLVPASRLTAALKHQLTDPIKFEYTNGVVGKMMAPASVSTLVLNIYRGILNILQLNIKKTHNVYELQEAGAQGVCKTTYAIFEEEKAEQIHVTKTRDLNQCQEGFIKDMGLAYTERCVKCQQDTKSLRGSTAYDYIFKSHAESVQILQVKANEVIRLAPLSERNGAVEMQTKQVFSFVEIQKTPIVVGSSPYVDSGSLRYEFPRELFQTPLQLVKIVELQKQIGELLDHLIANNVERVRENAPEKFLELIQLLRSASVQDLESIWTRSSKNTYRWWVWDSVAATGTPAALRFIKDKFLKKEVSVAEMAQAMVTSVHMVTATTETIEIFKDLAKRKEIVDSPFLREIVLLGYGTMIGKQCSQQAVCPVESIQFIHNLLSDAHSTKKISEIILHLKVLGNAGLPDSIKPITKILPIAHSPTDTSLPITVYAEAIMALRNIAKKEPKRIQELALQLYMDKNLDPELRMLSCIVLFETKPSLGLVTALANIVRTEESLQLVSFTYSHMKSLSRSTSIVHSSVAAACNIALRMLSPKLNRLSLRFSRAIHLDVYNSHYMLGAAANAFYINNAASILPRNFMAKASAYVSGAAVDVLEVGMRTEGLQELLLKNPTILNNEDRITKMRKAIQALSHWKSSPNAKPLASFYVKFMGQEIAFASIDQALQVSLKDEFLSLSLDRSVMTNFAHQLPSVESMRTIGNDIIREMASGISVNIVKPLLVSEVRRIMPTAAGFPLEFSLLTAAVTATGVRVKATMTPALPENFKLIELLQTDMQIESEIKPSIAVNTLATMGINTAMFQSGIVSRAKLTTTVPTNIVARLNLHKGYFKIEALPVSLPENIAAMHIETLAVTRNIEDLSAARLTPIIPEQVQNLASMEDLTSRNEKSQVNVKYFKFATTVFTFLTQINDIASFQSHSSEVYYQDHPRPFTKSKVARVKNYSAEILGLKGSVTMVTHNAAFIMDVPLYRLAGTHYAAVSITPVPGETYDRVELEVQVGPQAEEMLMKKINLNDEEITEGKPVLIKLQRLLKPTVNSASSVSGKSKGSSRGSDSRSVINLSSGSTSASNTTSRSSRQKRIKTHKFNKNHRKQYKSQMADSSGSAASFEAVYEQNKFLGSSGVPSFAVVVRAVKGKMVAGYQLAVYMDKPTNRIQMILADLNSENNWKLCADGIVLSEHRVVARIGYGAACNKYRATITAETGLVGPSPAGRLRVDWNEIPDALKRTLEKAMKSIPLSIECTFDKQRSKNTANQVSVIIVAPTEKTLDIILKTPTYTFFNLDVPLPITLPINEIHGLAPFGDIVDELHVVAAKAIAAQCNYAQNLLTTFNDIKYEPQMPPSCYQILVQDCTPELKFIVMLKNDNFEQKHINIKIADIDIDLFPKSGNIGVKVNGVEIPMENLPYHHPTVKIQIRQKGEGISVVAPSLGLSEVYMDSKSWKVDVVDWMKGQTCGLCGKADGEIKQEFRMPNGHLTKNAVTYAHSWILAAESCRDNSECRIKLDSVELEKQAVIYGQESRCFSVEPVLRCLPGCFPVKTTAVTVGFHCVAADSNVNKSEVLRGIQGKRVDLREKADAHLACSCTAQCV
ncbi:vitellogenin-1-like isoform X2 [Takifugu flavidus]|uniref:vitellogenin-1-like isoform X2 n=1 Tax=Takifugu flavidus TaxID=433684 RepID=UPI0025447257|nr:vitellogenin-1-like isoform X2 [Takifugu flavidus]